VKTQQAIKYYEKVKKIIGNTDMGPYYQSIGVFSDGQPIPQKFQDFEHVPESDFMDLKEVQEHQRSTSSKRDGSRAGSQLSKPKSTLKLEVPSEADADRNSSMTRDKLRESTNMSRSKDEALATRPGSQAKAKPLPQDSARRTASKQ